MSSKKKPAVKHTGEQIVPTNEGVQLQLVPDDNEPSFAHFNGVGLVFDAGTTVEEWQKVGVGMAHVNSVSGFALGDWLNYGAATFDKKQYKAAVVATGMKVGTLRNMASVAKRFSHDQRRVGLSFDHHRLLVPVKSPEKVIEIMDRVQKEGLSSNAMKELLPKTKKKAAKLTDEQRAAAEDKIDKKWRDIAEEFLDYLAGMPARHLASWSGVLDRLTERVQEVAPEAAAALAAKTPEGNA